MHRVKMIIAQKLIGLVLLACPAGQVLAQAAGGSAITFEQLSLQHGLSQSIVKSIAQDRNGFMYFGTEDGLNRYDGYRFTVIRHDPGDENTLSYNDINALCVDSRGFIWVGTFNAGLNRYDPASGNCLRFRHNPSDASSLSHDNILAIVEDRGGAIWVGCERGLNRLALNSAGGYRSERIRHDPADPGSLSNDQVYALCLDRGGALWVGTGNGLDRLESGQRGPWRFAHFRHDGNDPASLSDNSVRSILQDRQGDLWIGTMRGLNRAKARSGVPTFVRYRHDPRQVNSLSHDQIFALQEDASGMLWIGTNGGGLCLFDRERNAFSRYRYDPLNPRSVSYDEIRAICRDRQGIMWIGTYGAGIDKVARGIGQFVHFAHIPNSPDSIGHAIVWAIHEDDGGALWIGTHGGGLDRLDRASGRFRHYRAAANRRDRLSSDIVRIVRSDGAGGLWIGTHGGGICRFDPRRERFRTYRHDPGDSSSLAHDETREIYRDRSGTVWVGTYGHGLDRFDEATGTFRHFRHDPDDPRSLSNNFVRVIHEDAAGNFWIGTEGGGLNRFDRQAGTFHAYRGDAETGSRIDYILAIHEGKDGGLWLGTLGVGLTRFDPRRGTFKSYTTRDGLPNDYIYGILEDDGGNLWLSTNNGLSRFDPRRRTFRNFGMADGLQDREFNGGSYFKSRSGEMFFGGIKGFNAFFPARIQSNTYVPPVVIESFQKFNKDVALGRPVSEVEEIALSYRDTVFSFEFAALDFTAPDKNKYMYKMEGLNEQWIETGAEKRFAHFTTVPPGRYVFRVKGSNSDGVWNEAGASLKITIAPPYWKTWWFRTLAVLALLALASALYIRRLKVTAMKAELRTAHDAQMAIMPGSDPEVPGLDISGTCIPANEVGGDFFDFFWLDAEQTRFGILIGDVSGKAMKAAMTAVMANGMIISEALKADGTQAVLSHVNTPLFQKTSSQMFVAACLAVIDTRSRELILTNAGLTSPQLKSAGRVDALDLPGPRFPLGMVPKVDYEQKKLNLQSGDLLILATDGVSEAHNRSREYYGERRLKELLATVDSGRMSARRIRDAIVADVRSFSGSQTQFDDMTVVVVNVL